MAQTLQLDQHDSYLLAFNGGKIIRLKTGECIFERHLPTHIPKRLQSDARKHGIGMAAYGNGVLLAVNQCILTGDPDTLERVEPILFTKYFHEAEIYHSEPFYLEVSPKNVDKAYGLKYLLREIGIPREKMVCCGDSYNDIRMLQYAGVGIAMKNGPKKVNMVADFVTEDDNDHDGIAGTIKRFFPG